MLGLTLPSLLGLAFFVSRPTLRARLVDKNLFVRITLVRVAEDSPPGRRHTQVRYQPVWPDMAGADIAVSMQAVLPRTACFYTLSYPGHRIRINDGVAHDLIISYHGVRSPPKDGSPFPLGVRRSDHSLQSLLLVRWRQIIAHSRIRWGNGRSFLLCWKHLQDSKLIWSSICGSSTKIYKRKSDSIIFFSLNSVKSEDIVGLLLFIGLIRRLVRDLTRDFTKFSSRINERSSADFLF